MMPSSNRFFQLIAEQSSLEVRGLNGKTFTVNSSQTFYLENGVYTVAETYRSGMLRDEAPKFTLINESDSRLLQAIL